MGQQIVCHFRQADNDCYFSIITYDLSMISDMQNYTGSCLTQWGRVTDICIGKLTIIASDNGLSPEPRQAIIWTNAGILLIGPLGTNFCEF